MKYYCITLILVLYSQSLLAQKQNLIPNPSFEQLEPRGCRLCESHTATFQYWTFPWIHPTRHGSVDIYVDNGFSREGLSKGDTAWTHTGNVSVGAALLGEPFGVPLKKNLTKGKYYQFSVWIYQPSKPECSSNNIGFCFSTEKLSEQNENDYRMPPLTGKPQINTSEVIEPKGNWVELKREFQADSAYGYLYVANFFGLEKTAYKTEGQGLSKGKVPFAYYIFDDFSLIELSQEEWGVLHPPKDTLEYTLQGYAKLIQFEKGSAQLTAKSKETLNELAVLIQAHKQLQFNIEGHTDNIGDAKTNQQLSEDRASAVKEYLIVKGGIGEERLTALGHGESKPLYSTVENRQYNRRVEVNIAR